MVPRVAGSRVACAARRAGEGMSLFVGAAALPVGLWVLAPFRSSSCGSCGSLLLQSSLLFLPPSPVIWNGNAVRGGCELPPALCSVCRSLKGEQHASKRRFGAPLRSRSTQAVPRPLAPSPAPPAPTRGPAPAPGSARGPAPGGCGGAARGTLGPRPAPVLPLPSLPPPA